jgi:pSer/pThr/pTyr-binding forkhead associated (FHA) protein
VRSFLLSWLAKQHAASDLRTFERELPGPWLVWEAGPWRPPQPDRDTLLAGGRGGRTPSDEALVLEVSPRPGRARFEGVRLGRGPDNDLVVEDGTLSRAHLLFHMGEAGWTVQDLGSSNGTLVEGRAVRAVPAPLHPGATIDAGAVRFTFYDAKGLFLRTRLGAP